ncbi:uncharacterized protein F5147DRAFT_771549 [Suillus discolor]|uniref:DUF6533 domain-containing protein n=1 Tax=Suillus discolor TaxID=1912936 RepID=A0A9P7JVQ9_9AGAM|nr:uncharacterized protein F5147DRAFT_771549 [Suillus discolor]KAG2111971.1 hypothetical protein F5147DRAFT_771549 [Suillus discolor]
MATLPEEIMFIWRRPKSKSAVLFLVNRYVAVLVNTLVLMSTFLPVSTERFQLCFFNIYYFTHQRLSCRNYVMVIHVLRVFQQVFICLTLTLRTYALYGRSRRLLKWMLILGAVFIATSVVGAFRHNLTESAIDNGHCHEIYTTPTPLHHGTTWVTMFIYELIIFVLTVFGTWKARGSPQFSLVSRRDILDVIFQDGVMYFAGMALVNLPNILTYFCGPDIARGSLNEFTTCVSVTLISRLMLNLHGCVDTGILSTLAEASSHVLTEVDVEFADSSYDP